MIGQFGAQNSNNRWSWGGGQMPDLRASCATLMIRSVVEICVCCVVGDETRSKVKMCGVWGGDKEGRE